MRTIKFRAWDKDNEFMVLSENLMDVDEYFFQFNNFGGIELVQLQYTNIDDENKNAVIVNSEFMQFTGLLDKNRLQDVYEGDIIDEYGNIKGNAHEMDKGENDLLIQGLGTSAWSETEKKGLERGLKYS